LCSSAAFSLANRAGVTVRQLILAPVTQLSIRTGNEEREESFLLVQNQRNERSLREERSVEWIVNRRHGKIVGTFFQVQGTFEVSDGS
jgi:hypothetical protein